MENDLLTVQNVSISFTQYVQGLKQHELKVISDLSLSVKEGEVVAILGSSGSGKDANLDAWEKLVKQKKHLVETDQMTQEQYYDWLRSEYKSHLSDTEKYADELMSIEKELYDWEKQRIQASIDDELAVLDNQKAKGLISEEEYFKKLDELYSDGYSDLQQAVEEHNLYGVDNTERLQAETEFLEKVKDAHNSAYDAERQALDHKLAMNLISEEQYLIELQRLYDQYYKGQDMYSEEAMEIEEELYDKRVELVENGHKQQLMLSMKLQKQPKVWSMLLLN